MTQHASGERGAGRSLRGALLGVAALTLFACGSSNNSTGPAATSAAATPSGPPIKVMTISTVSTQYGNNPTAWSGAKAGAARVNAGGGTAGGRPIEVVTCNDQGTPDGAGACAQQAVDQKVAAVIGSYSRGSGARIIPLLEQAQIPDIANQVISPQDSTSKVAFPINGSAPALYGGSALLIAGKGAKKISVVRADASSTANLEKYVVAALNTKGIPVNDVTIPSGTVDFAPIVAASTQNTDGVVLMTDKNSTTQWLTAAHSAGVDLQSKIKAVANPAVVDISTQKSLAEGVYLADHYPAEKSGLADVDQAYADIRNQPTDNIADTVSLNAYFGVITFAAAIKNLTSVDGPSALAAMNKVSGLKVGGRTLDFTTENPRTGLNRIFNTQVFTFRVQNQAITSLSSTPIDGLPKA
jgi:ABC-type branched-subunit amino acid transport system substrate-binding protein